MTTTLITDGFDGEIEAGEIEHNYEPHNIVYGSLDWTDALDDATLHLLLAAGIVRHERTINGVGFETRIFVSNEGVGPA